jgi:hypothetical protein
MKNHFIYNASSRRGLAMNELRINLDTVTLAFLLTMPPPLFARGAALYIIHYSGDYGLFLSVSTT